MKKIKLSVAVGLVATIVVIISDIFNYFTGWGAFAWITFILWSFTLAYLETAKNDDLTIKKIPIFLVGLPIGVALANIMIFVPEYFDGNLIVKYVTVFFANVIALTFPNKMTYGIFCGISFTFAGLGIGIIPNSFENVLKMLTIIITFSILGQLCPVLTNIFNKLLTKKE